VFTTLTLVVLAGLAGPLLAAGRRPRIPVLVGELIGGAFLGRTGFQLIDPSVQPLTALSTLGFAMLMLESGAQVDIASPHLRRGALRALPAFAVVSMGAVLAGPAIAALGGSSRPALFAVLLAGSSAAVAFPTIQEQKLDGPAIGFLLAWIAIADAVTALLLPLTLTGPGRIPLAILGDAAIVGLAAVSIVLGDRLLRTGMADAAFRQSKQRRWALRLRLGILLLLALGAISEETGGSLLIAGFAAGIVLRRFREPRRLELELTGLAGGFFVPVFFVILGATLDLRGLLQSPAAIGLALLLAAGAVIVHLAGAFAGGREQRVASGLLASVQLGLPAAAAALGLSTHAISAPVAAALVAGGVLTLLPATAGAILLARGQAAARSAA
jgi:Kef-type K+ transport system membrane component KefB